MTKHLGFKLAATAFTAASLLAMAPAAATAASTVTVSTTLDLAQLEPGKNGFSLGAQDSPPFSAITPFDLAENDTLDFTIDFLGNQELTLNNPSSIWAFIYADETATAHGSGTLSLLDLDGNAILTSNTRVDEEGIVHFGQYFDPSDFTSLPSTVTFAGLRYIGTLTDYTVPLDHPEAPDVTTRHYTSPALYIVSESFLGAGAVPEPATWAMLIAGFGLLGMTLRRRQRALLA